MGQIKEPSAKRLAKEICSKALEVGRLQEFIHLKDFSLKGEAVIPTTLLEIQQEMKLINRQHEHPIRIPYDESNSLHDYFDRFMPTKVQLELFYHYGYQRLSEIIHT